MWPRARPGTPRGDNDELPGARQGSEDHPSTASNPQHTLPGPPGRRRPGRGGGEVPIGGRPPPVAPAPVISREPEITAALSALPERDREALLLAVWDELPAREVGKVLGISANAAAIRIHRAKRRMRELLKEA